MSRVLVIDTHCNCHLFRGRMTYSTDVAGADDDWLCAIHLDEDARSEIRQACQMNRTLSEA